MCGEPCISINEVNLADIVVSADADIDTPGGYTDFKQNENVEATSMSLSQGGQESEHAPHVGMEFQTHEEAYNFYNSYALIVGYSTLKIWYIYIKR